MAAKRLRVHGKVQGVFYRAWTVQQAKALGLAGWVRNRTDGSVEILASGGDSAIEALIARCRQGPPAAHVERIDIEDAEAEGETAGDFRQQPTR